ncbi:MAG: hypothetical protein Ta2B_22040 [Termitinemataceae bacterium]|nr:MAG: hypothetical protein Ta2B_22040 [Termitinemataceae bacterium]
MKKHEEKLKSSFIKTVLKSITGLGITRKETIATLLSFIICAAFTLWYNVYSNEELIGRMLLLILFYVLFVLYSGRQITGKRRSDSEVVLLSILITVYYIASVAVRGIKILDGFFPVSIMLPTALVVMLISISIDSRIAQTLALAIPLGAFLIGSFDINAYCTAAGSAVAGAFVLRDARRRIDLLKSGLYVAIINIATVSAVLLIRDCPLSYYPFILFWALINGVVSGMLVLGILPIIENALHLATTFKLIELLDIGSPILKKLATTAPGTWSHSMMVASLAEEGCREIGAKALLARVGAYYHDIGKIDQPDYFVENQKDENKLIVLNPRLSATVIRSHVKLGVEKARQVGLPKEVIEIISEHHGDSLIKWFYNAAKEKEGEVNVEDFCYPGNPPCTKESAVVMLADVTEAATRTLEKPTVARLEKFIQGLFDDKVAAGELSRSALTFRDLQTIKNTFVRVLLSYSHSRIEYPKAEVQAK